MKKLRLILSLVCLVALGLLPSITTAQISKGGLPPSFSLKKGHTLNKKAQLEVPVNFSVKELLEEDAFNAKNEINRPRVAVKIPANISIDNSGEWLTLPSENEKRLWRVAIEAKDATAIILSYDDFYLPIGSKLFIYNKERTHILGAFDHTTNPRGGIFSTNFIAGDVAILEYIAPLSPSSDKARIKISGIGYGYNHLQIVPQPLKTRGRKPPVGESNKCQVNVVCSPEGDLWTDNSKSVCQMTMLVGNNWGFCSGTLINNTNNDGTPYIISAFHCYDGATEEDILQWQFNFFYKSSDCATNKDYYDNMQTLVGAKLRAYTPINGGSDGLLLELEKRIPAEWIASDSIQWAGWDRRKDPAVMAQRGVGIHHPAGDVQKISTYNTPAKLVGTLPFGKGIITAMDAHWEVFFERTPNGYSSTEGGSSGSGILNQDHLLIGTLSGGPGFDCDGDDTNISYYGTLAYHWDKHGNSPKTQMKTWLDPKDTKAETCEAYPASKIIMDFTGGPREIYALQSVNFSAIARNADSIRWTFPGGTPATTTEINPTITYNEKGVFDVQLTVYKKNEKGEDTILVEKKEKYIQVRYKGVPGTLRANVAALAPEEGSSDLDDFNADNIKDIYTIEALEESPVNWEISANMSDNFPVESGYDGIGDNCAWYKYASGQGSAHMYKTINIANYDRPTLSFQYLIRGFTFMVVIADNLQVLYRENPEAEWEILHDAESKPTCLNSEPDVWGTMDINLPKTSSTEAQIAFKAIARGLFGIAIDNVNVYNAVPAKKVKIWEEEPITFFDFSTGNAVLYEYTFDGGNPKTSKTDKESIEVKYNKAGKYSISQWVKNTINEDTITHKEYVEVMARHISTDKKELKQACGAAFTDKLTLTANKNWRVIAPDWIIVEPMRGSVTTPGENQDFPIEIEIIENPNSSEGRSGYINFFTNDGLISTAVQVTQPSTPPAKIKVDSTKGNNIHLSWNQIPGTWMHPCDIKRYGGDFEDTTIYSQNWTAIPKGRVHKPFNPKGWKPNNMPHSAQEKDSYMISASTVYYHQFAADNWLITPKLKPDANNKTLSFWITSDNPYKWKKDHYEVRLSTAENISTDDFTVVLKERVEADFEWENITITLADEYIDKEVYIAFRHIDSAKFRLAIDNVTGIPVANCKNATDSQSAQPQMLNSKNAVIMPLTDISVEEVLAHEKQLALEEMRQQEFVKNFVMCPVGGSSGLSTQTSKAPADVSNLKEFSWCGELYKKQGLSSGGNSLSIAARWAAGDLKQITGAKIKAIEIALMDDAEIELFIMDGAVEIYNERIPTGKLAIGKPSIVELNRPVSILGVDEIYIGYKILPGYKGGTLGLDEGPKVAGKGNMLYIPQYKRWFQLTDLDPDFNINWYIKAYGDGGGGEGYSLYRKRANDTNGDYQFVASGITDTTFVDKNVKPGGKVCYQVRYVSNGAESCSSEDNDCATIIYSQNIEAPKLIEKAYGEPNFTLGFADNSDIKLRSSIEGIDNVKSGDFPVTLAIEGGTSDVIDLEGKPGKYSIKIKKIGEAKLIATQEGVANQLLPAESVFIDIKIKPTKLIITAKDMEKEEGEENPVFECIAEGIAYGETASNLQVKPEYTCFAKANSPMGEYIITVFAQDPNYEIECKPGKLTVKKTSRTDINIFTPYSADGYNDYFMAGHKIKVFSRQGVLVYETSNTQELSSGWNGKISKTQKMADPGVYYYVVIDEKGKTIDNGSVTLVKY